MFTGRFLERTQQIEIPDREKYIGNEILSLVGIDSRDTPKNGNSFDRRFGFTNDNIHSDALQ
jgi:hypothetical protein